MSGEFRIRFILAPLESAPTPLRPLDGMPALRGEIRGHSRLRVYSKEAGNAELEILD